MNEVFFQSGVHEYQSAYVAPYVAKALLFEEQLVIIRIAYVAEYEFSGVIGFHDSSA
jgi:hypothetical protein